MPSLHEGALARTDPSGTVGQVSRGTPMGPDAAFYRRIPLAPMAYGRSLTVLMLGEALARAPEVAANGKA